MDQASVAVIGSGYWGRNLVRNYQQLGALKLICDKSETTLNKFSEKYPNIETCLDLGSVISRDEIKGVVIATPAETHYPIARRALLAGKHVYVEKPMVLDEKEAESLIAIAKKANLTLMVGHLLQYHPAFMRLKEMVGRGELGRINYIYSNRLNLGKIRREENILWSFAPHDISMIMALANEEPESVYASGGNYLHQKVADVTTMLLDFPSGLKAHIFVSWLHPYKEHKLVVVGDRKMAVFNDTAPNNDKLLLYPHLIDWQNSIPVPNKANAERVSFEDEEPLKRECKHFLECISNGTRPLSDGSEGLRVLRILKAGQRALHENGCKIHLKRKENPTDIVPPDTSGAYFVHHTTSIDDDVSIGKGSKIWHFSHVLSNSTIGENCNIGQNVVIGPDVSIGNNCKIQNNVSVYKGVTLEDAVFCGPSIVFTNISNPRADISKIDRIRTTLVRHGATIGGNATIVCGTTLGRYCFIGAGAVVVHDVQDQALVVGNPATQIGWMCVCGERLSDSLTCPECDTSYRITENELETFNPVPGHTN